MAFMILLNAEVIKICVTTFLECILPALWNYNCWLQDANYIGNISLIVAPSAS